jgi:hypothetical protein
MKLGKAVLGEIGGINRLHKAARSNRPDSRC